jgi:hypothetical protein
MREVVGTPEFAAWYEALTEAETEAVTRAIAVVEEVGTETPRVRAVTLMPQLERRGRIALHELDVCAADLKVLFAVESGSEERVVLLYGFGERTTRRPEAPPALPAPANHVLAVTIYWEYKKESA